MTQTVAANPCAAPTLATRPTVVIGLGGLAGRVVSGLRKRLRERFGEPVNPSLSILALDTDHAALRALEGSEAGGLAPEETLHLPLRKPGDYRSASDEILAWLSRRWLYNIPRSLRTEGLRPLGRLAFVGHREVVDERLAAALTGVKSAAAPGGSPRVYIITSIGGGTGGGMVLDVAYAVRQRLDELRLPVGGIYGILLHATFAASAGNDLRAANAYATLTELNHFMQGKAAYHAGPMAILPAGDVSEPPFAGAYLVDLGDEAGQAEFDEAIERVVEYLYLDVATPAGALIERWRKADGDRHAAANSLADDATSPVQLRSFGLHTLRFSKSIVAARQSDRLCLRLVRKWLGEREDRQSDGPRIETADFQLADLVARLTALAEKALGGSAESHFRTLLAAGPGGPPIVLDDDPIGPYGDDLRRIHALLGPPPSADVAPPAHPLPLERALREGASKLAAAAAHSLAESIRELIERPRGRLPAATTAISLLQGRLRDLRRSADEGHRHDHEQATLLLYKLQRGELPRGTAWFGRFSASAKTPDDVLLDYCRSRLRSIIHKCVSALSQEVASEVASLGDRLVRLRQSVQWLANEFAMAHDESVSPWLSTCEGNLGEQLAPLAEPCFVEQFDEALQHELLEGRGGLVGLADESPDGLKSLRRELHRRGCERVAPLLDDVDAWHLLAKANPTAEKLDAAIRSAVEKTSVRLPHASPAERLLVLMPRGAKGKVIVDALRHAWPDGFVVPSHEGDLVFCREVEGISLADAASVLVKGRQECAAAARHVLTRVDVSWATLGTG